MKTNPRLRRPNFSLYIVVFARYVVLASTAIATYCLCYLVDQHRRHYCTWNTYGSRTTCTPEHKKNIKVPWAEIVFLAACVLATLESMFSTFLSMRSGRLDCKMLFFTSAPCSLLFGVAWKMFFDLPSVILSPSILSLCPPGPNNPGRDVRLAPETYDCCIALGVVIAGGIAVVFQSLITLIAGVSVVRSENGKTSVEGTSGEKGDDEEREALLDL